MCESGPFLCGVPVWDELTFELEASGDNIPLFAREDADSKANSGLSRSSD